MHKRSILLTGSLLLSTSLMACGLFGGSQQGTSGDLSEEESIVLEETLDDRLGERKANEGSGDDTVMSKWGPDSAKAVEKYSLYYTYYKQNDYKSAYGPWKWMINNAPRQSVNLYIRGVRILEFKYSNAGMGEKEQYLESLMDLYDQRIKYFNREGYVLGRKGMNLLQLDPTKADQAYDILSKAIEMRGKDAKPYVPYYYVYAATQLRDQEKLPRKKLLATNDKAMKILKANLGSDPDYKKMKGRVEGLMGEYLSCSDLINRYKPKLKKGDGKLNKLKEYRSSLKNKGCTNDPFYLKLNEQIFEQEPKANVAAVLARKWKDKKNTDKAIDFYKKAIELKDDKAKAAQYALSIASLYKEQKSDYPKAAKYAKKAINMKDGYGKAHLLLGDIYVSGKEQCKDEFQQKAVHWLAVDHYQMAKEKDKNVVKDAEKRIKTYRKGFPTKEKVFFKELEEGDTYTVECWINETTTVRVPE